MTDAPALNDDFVDLLQALDDQSAEFVIVGGYALAVHGYPRERFGPCEVPFIGLDALIRNERATGRTKDAADVEQLEKLRG